MEHGKDAGSGNIGAALLSEIQRVQGGGKSAVVKTAVQPEAKAPASEKKPVAKVKKPVAKKTTAKAPAVSFSALQPRVETHVSNEELEQAAQQAKDRSEQLYMSAARYLEICSTIEKLSVIPDVEISDYGKKLREAVEDRDRIDATAASLGPEVESGFRANVLIVELKARLADEVFDANYVVATIKKIKEMGRGRTPEAGENFKTVPLEEKIFFVHDGQEHCLLHNFSKMPGREGRVSSADKLLFLLVRKMIGKILHEWQQRRDAEARAENAKADRIVTEQGLHPSGIKRKMLGTYILYLPPKIIGENNKRRAVGMAGAIKFELVDMNKGKNDPFLVIRILEVAGSLKPGWPKTDGKPYQIYWHWLKNYAEKGDLSLGISSDIRPAVESFFRKLIKAINIAEDSVAAQAANKQMDEIREKHESIPETNQIRQEMEEELPETAAA